MHDTKISFPDDLKGQFRNLVNSRCGLYFKDYDLKDLEGAIRQRMKVLSLDSPFAYYNLLTFSDKKEDEFRDLVNLITVRHTYFFRNEPQFNVLKDKILQEIVRRKSTEYRAQSTEKPTIRVWSAGCSTGEEPYSIAMTVMDAVGDLDGWNIEILATDASTEALDNARRGVYGESAMRLVDAGHRAKYFKEEMHGREKRYALRDEVKELVSFSYFNLMEEEFPSGFDVIFCRNVVIYFELETTIRVMNKFAGSLNDNGYFFIGYSESLQFISDKFKMADLDDAIFYTKAKGAAVFPHLKKPEHPAREARKAITKISKAEVEAESDERWAKSMRSAKLKSMLAKINEAIHMKRYDEALALVAEARSIDAASAEPYYFTAEVYANRGLFREAKENLEAALEKNMLFAPAHYLLGSICMEEGDVECAEKSFRRALYLDGGFSPAHFGLANIYRDLGKSDDAMREYRNTLNILSNNELYDILSYSGGFNTATLAGVCRNNIERLKTA